MTTEAIAPAGPATAPADGEVARLAAAVSELEGRPVSALRTLTEPATALMRRAEEFGEADLVQRCRLLVISVMMREGQIEDGGRQAHQILAWAQRQGSPYLLARAHREVSLFYRLVGDVSSAHTHALQGLSCLPEDADVGIRARHLLTLAIALDENGHSADGDRRFAESLDIAMALADGELIAQVLNNMAYTAFERDDEPLARRYCQQMRDVAAEQDFPLSAGQLDTIARVEMMSGDYDRAAATLAPVLEPNSKVAGNEGDALATCLLTMAETLRLGHRYAEAQAALDAGAAMAEERNLRLIRAQVREGQAALYADTGRYKEAYEEHRVFYAEATALHSAQREARAHALQAAYDATEARRVSEELRELAHRDALTGLYNRRYVDERLPALLTEAAARRTPISLAIVDLDHFKRVNDTLSHSTGDTVLRQIGQLLAEAATGRTVAARLGGEEFLLILPDVDAREALLLCEELRLRIRGHDWSSVTHGLPVTTSIGVTTAVDGPHAVSDLLERADHHLYTAKRAGRDRVVGA
ncbi:GGDEF domain-containing protein [Actinoplanes sp. NPDC051411]|uniref:tetratricopeptide repeat-containing diguanylate cyclase n=1 Tax=Actinoplanes sp. NPDC051411 TaxID=3155522 RepID=UPI003420B89B